jgi:hypothetical protein
VPDFTNINFRPFLGAQTEISSGARRGRIVILCRRRSVEDTSTVNGAGGRRAKPMAGHIASFKIEASRPLSRTELVEFRMTVDAAIWVRDADVSAPIPHKLDGFFDGRRSRVPFERHRPG